MISQHPQPPDHFIGQLGDSSDTRSPSDNVQVPRSLSLEQTCDSCILDPSACNLTVISRSMRRAPRPSKHDLTRIFLRIASAEAHVVLPGRRATSLDFADHNRTALKGSHIAEMILGLKQPWTMLMTLPRSRRLAS